ncbi:hypothetical protein ACFOLJ_08590 [Rugamonas sp. CCM 8940]|uniref:hypothetical protein n=1 Tax=Rugamonas sp. CCM 8940 TaxID=2765359 RepID=UPI0018F282A8|nr:hypothetical protein [Rugamonas sp. CCM 8940]MBJ7309476.1 hypothetical protein [Rugamonas sp. CCM 8940]
MRILFFAGLSAALALLASANGNAQSGSQSPASPYAVEACQSGCFAVRAQTRFYFGDSSRSYRVCALDAFDAKLSVDGTEVRVPGNSAGRRGCADVAGRDLTLLDGNAMVGRLPQ